MTVRQCSIRVRRHNVPMGRAEFEKQFKTVFQQIRDSKTAAPYMDIQPKEMRIQFFGDVAIATCHLDDGAGFLNRRTIVLNKTEKGWKIVHLQSSEVSVTGIARSWVQRGDVAD